MLKKPHGRLNINWKAQVSLIDLIGIVGIVDFDFDSHILSDNNDANIGN